MTIAHDFKRDCKLGLDSLWLNIVQYMSKPTAQISRNLCYELLLVCPYESKKQYFCKEGYERIKLCGTNRLFSTHPLS